MKVEIKPTIIDKKEYVTVSQMALLTHRSDQTIYSLIKKGNAIRKMESMRIIDRLLIPLSELEDFPFTYTGRNCQQEPYHYNKQGEIQE